MRAFLNCCGLYPLILGGGVSSIFPCILTPQDQNKKPKMNKELENLYKIMSHFPEGRGNDKLNKEIAEKLVELRKVHSDLNDLFVRNIDQFYSKNENKRNPDRNNKGVSAVKKIYEKMGKITEKINAAGR